MRGGATLTLVLSVLLFPSGTPGQSSVPSEYQVKAAFVFNFAKFVEWPAAAFNDDKAPLSIGVVGDNPLGPHLEQLVRDKTLNNRSVIIKECRTPEEGSKCHILFIHGSENKRQSEILQQMAKAHVLTVGETDDFIKSGGMINFYREGNRFRFQINDTPARKSGLKIDSKLLGLGKKPGS